MLSAAANQPAAAATVSVESLMAPGPIEEQALGAEDAPVTVVEYASMTCGHCANFHTQTLPGIKEKYVATGKVRFIYRDYPLDPLAMGAAMLARCAPKERYFDFVSLLFEQQRVWAYSQNPLAALEAIAKQVGFTQESFNSCLSRQELLDGLNAVKQKASDEFGVGSTPTFFINGELVKGALTVEEFEKKLEPHF
ncbi:MAG: DsbA family protein [Hyphomicrobiales bacterium]|nr:DsbA family protein [Hyphomicrobiales bacterium]